MSIILRHVRRLLADDDGVTAIEYALIASLIALAIVGAAASIGTSLTSTFSGIVPKL